MSRAMKIKYGGLLRKEDTSIKLMGFFQQNCQSVGQKSELIC